MSRTSNARRSAILAACLWVGAAAALPCDRIDYVEAKDWKPEALERAYCMDGKRGALHHELWQKLRAEGLLSGTDSRRIMADYQSCLDQQSLYSRILKNVHGREAPSCK